MDIVIEQGATFRMHCEVYSIDNQIVPLTNVSEVRATVRYAYDADEPLLTFTCAVEDAAGGVASVYASDADTEALTPGRYVWDMEILFASGDVLRLLAGIADVTAEATHG